MKSTSEGGGVQDGGAREGTSAWSRSICTYDEHYLLSPLPHPHMDTLGIILSYVWPSVSAWAGRLYHLYGFCYFKKGTMLPLPLPAHHGASF
jgi:hypothetical protein